MSPEVVRVFHGSCFQASWKFCGPGVSFDEGSNPQIREQRIFDRMETVCLDIYALRVNLRFLFGRSAVASGQEKGKAEATKKEGAELLGTELGEQAIWESNKGN